MSKVVDVIRELCHPITEQQQVELVDVVFEKEGKEWFLRVFIDKPEGIDIDDCALFSEQLSDAIDRLPHDPIPQAYFLEVSSPGAERPLKSEADLQRAIGQYIHVSFYQAVDKQKFIEGTLLAVTEDALTVRVTNKTREKEHVFLRNGIANIRLAIKF